MSFDESKTYNIELSEDVVPENEAITLDTSSVDAAKQQAAALWKVSVNDVDAEILEEGKILFGLLGKKMKVKITSKAPLMHLQARDFVNAVIEQSDLDIKAELAEVSAINLDGPDSAIIIGRHGETLKALEFITNLIYRPDQNQTKIRIDCGGYRARREESLMGLAESVAREVVHKRSAISLEPMSSWERRIIHVALQGHRDITTTSQGEEPFRKIVVAPKYPRRNDNKRKNFRKRRY